MADAYGARHLSLERLIQSNTHSKYRLPAGPLSWREGQVRQLQLFVPRPGACITPYHPLS